MRKATVRQYAEAYLSAAQAAPVQERVEVADRLVRTLARQRQLRLVPRIATELERLIAEQGGPLIVKVRSAKAFTTAEDTELSANLEKALNQKVKIRHVHEPKLLAGVKIQVGDRLIDNALASRLATLKSHLLQ
jgi:F-type H+-transporting ATPase subunit delta